MDNNRSSVNNLLGLLALLVAIVTLLFGDNWYEQLTGRSFFSPQPTRTPSGFASATPEFSSREQLLTGTPSTVSVTESFHFLPSINAKVVGLNFFEAGYDSVPFGERVYNTTFKQETTRYIFWELRLELPPPGRQIDFRIDTVYFKSDGSILTEGLTETYILPDWGLPHFAHGIGWDDPGKWSKDTYTVVFFIESDEIVKAVFTIE